MVVGGSLDQDGDGAMPCPFQRCRVGSHMQWFLPAAERGNPDTVIDRANGIGYTRGNLARPLIDGKAYFAELLKCINTAGDGDLIWFTDWQSNAD
ncbi:UNVERIFIED_CONTAM: hypothetical protein FO487_22210, partial [Bacillus amyloliquefaciens DSM 7 = ATCC 23350]